MHRLAGSGWVLQQPAPLTVRQRVCLAVILLVAVALRFIQLDSIPPGLWFDEALYAMDGYGVSRGNFAVFYAEGGHPREALFPWLLGLAFALAEPTVLVARCVSAACGSLAVALFFLVARRWFTPAWALYATAAFAVFRWHIHFSRTIFRAGLASLLMLLVVWLFLRWRERKRPLDAVLCGGAVGLCFYTYISLRVVPLLLALWIGWMAWRGALSLRREWRQIALLYGTALVLFVPLLADYLWHPDHFSGRTSEITMFEKTVQVTNPDGTVTDKRVAKPLPEAVAGIAGNAAQVAGAWFIKGDHVAKHNVPYRPVFDPLTGALFALGLGLSLWWVIAQRAISGVVLVTWFGGFCLASVFSFGAPNILRMQGASPVVILLMVLGLQRALAAWPTGVAGGVRRVLPGLVLVLFAGTQLNDYFRNFPSDIRVRQEFTADILYEPARGVDAVAGDVDVVYVPAELMQSLQFRFATVRCANVRTYAPDEPLPEPAAGSSAAWLITMRSVSLAAEHGQDHRSQLRAVAGVRSREHFFMPEAGDDGRVLRQSLWAELWVRE